ncbi:MAG: hypothetical protein ACSLFM_03700 [Tepidiformaceae bacterium]
MAATYTIDVENQVILDPGTESELNLTALGLECSGCARTFPTCGSIRPGSDCPVFIAALHLRMIEPKELAPPLVPA